MNKIIVTPRKVRGLGNVLKPKTCKNFSTHNSELIYEDGVYKLSLGDYNLELTMTSNTSNFQDITLKAILKRVNETTVTGEEITIYDGDEEIASGITDNKGVFSCNVSELDLRKHIFIAVCDNLHVSSNYVNVNVSDNAGLSLSSNYNNIFENGEIILTGVLSHGSGYDIKLYQDGTLIDTVTTDADGVFTKTVSNLTAGHHVFRAIFIGDSNHNRIVSNSVNVNVEYGPVLSLNIDGDYTGNSLDKLTLNGTITQNNIPIRGKVLQIYRNTNNGWEYLRTINSDNAGNYSFIDYGVLNFIDNTTAGSRDELQSLITNAINNGDSEINLTRKYVFQSGDSVINIPGSIRINGNGHIIDANTKSQIFNITGNNVTLDNLILINSRANGKGGAINWSGDNGVISNTLIANCIANNDGGGVYWNGLTGTVQNCRFLNNATNANGGAICIESDNFQVLDMVSFANHSNGDGGCLYSDGGSTHVNGLISEKDTTNGGTRGTVKIINGIHPVIEHASVTSPIYGQNYVDRTTRPVNGEFKYKVRPSPAWIENCDDYAVENTYYPMNISLSGNDIHVDETLTLTGKLGTLSGKTVKIYQGDNLIGTVTTGANGTFTKQITGLTEGEYNFYAFFEGDNQYDSIISETITITVEYSPVITLNITGDYTGNSLDKLTLNGNVTHNNIPLTAKALQIYRYTSNGWDYMNTITTDNEGDYSFIDYGVLNFIDNTTAGSRDELQSLITNAINNGDSEINLTRKYVFQSGDSVINIPGSIRINGNGHIIDANGKSNIFNVTGDDVTLDNLILINGNTMGTGGAVRWSGDDGTLSNSLIANNIANSHGGGVYWNGLTGTVQNCRFLNNATNANGGAICIESDNFQVLDMVSFANYSNGDGGCLYSNGGSNLFRGVHSEKDTTNGGTRGTVKVNGVHPVIDNSSVTSPIYGQNYINRTTRPVNGEFKYKVRPSPAWSKHCDDYAIEDTFIPQVQSIISSVSVSSNKLILSAADNEYATLTATVLDNNNQEVNGQTVSFEVRKVSDDSLVETLSGNTNQNGIATVSYYGKGAGDIYIKAICSNINSNIVDIEDCQYFNDCSSILSTGWNVPNSVEQTLESNGLKITGTTYTRIISDITQNNPFSISFKIVNNYSGGILHYCYKDGTSTNVNLFNVDYQTKKISCNFHDTGIVYTPNVEYRIEYYENQIKLYENDVLIDTQSHNIGFPTKHEIHTGTNRWVIYKDIKLKLL